MTRRAPRSADGRVALAALVTLSGLFATAAADTDAAADPPPASAPVVAPASPSGTSHYTLFDPVPADQLRPFNADRPSVTTGPFTVDAGHVQFESSFLTYTRDAGGGGTAGDLFTVLPTEARVGVLSQVEVDLTVSPFLYQRTPAVPVARPRTTAVTPPAPPPAAASHATGFGDLQVQSKLNLFGDDGGVVAAAVIPYLTLPTASATRGLGTGRVQGGLILPLQLNLPADWTVAAEAEFDFPRNDADTATGFDCLHTVEVSRPIVGPLSAYAEYAGTAPVRLGHGYQATVDAGLTYAVTGDVQLDGGINVGRSRDAPAYTILTGITVRR